MKEVRRKKNEEALRLCTWVLKIADMIWDGTACYGQDATSRSML